MKPLFPFLNPLVTLIDLSDGRIKNKNIVNSQKNRVILEPSREVMSQGYEGYPPYIR